MKNFVVANGEIVRDLTVHVAFRKRQAPFSKFALLNLESDVDLLNLTGLQAKLLLALLFSPRGCRLKELTLAVGASTASVNRSLRGLLAVGKIERPERGYYRAAKSLLHFGRWNDATDKGQK